MKAKLFTAWNSFLGNLQGAVFVKKIQHGIDEKLLSQLRESTHFSKKAEKIHRMNSQREKEWAEARRGELEMEQAFEQLMGGGPFNMLSSISHTKDIVIGVSCILNAQSKVQGIGIDIEDSQRNLDDNVIQRFMSSSELAKYNDIKAIDFWVLKEAAFKATPKDLQLVVTSYDLSRWDGHLKTGVMQSKNAHCEVQLLKLDKYSIGLSYFRF